MMSFTVLKISLVLVNFSSKSIIVHVELAKYAWTVRFMCKIIKIKANCS